jgi:hypothetical protein
MTASLNIRGQAMDKVFKVRFVAEGANSLNIVSWFVDNIHIYRVCDGPTDLTSMIDWVQSAVILNWVAPETGEIDEWIHYDDGVNYNAIGTGGAAEFDVAARWGAGHNWWTMTEPR